MLRRARSIEGGRVYRASNRSKRRAALLLKEEDYAAFERVPEKAFQRVPLRIVRYCVMQRHWHMVVVSRAGQDRQVSEFLRWLTVTHAQRWHAHYHTAGYGQLHQGRFKSFQM
jgi:putative transposase